MMAHVARFRVSSDLLAQALHMPEGSTILRVIESPDILGAGPYEFIVEHPSLSEVQDGTLIPRVYPRIVRTLTYARDCRDPDRMFTEYDWQWRGEYE
jgi:hypothetical protein